MKPDFSRWGQHAAALLFILLLAAAGAIAAVDAPGRVAPASAAPHSNNSVAVVPSLARIDRALAPLTSERASLDTSDTSEVKWLDGAMQSTMDYQCISGNWGLVTSESIGYLGNEDVTSPKVGEVFYVRVIVAGVGQPCAGPYAHIEILLPDDMAFAIDKTNKVHCFSGDIETWNIKEVAAADCPQKMRQGTYGVVFDRASGEPWDVRGKVVIVAVPVLAFKPLKGIADNTWIYAGVQAIDGMSDPWDNPKQGVFVAENPPAVSYDKQSTSKITGNSAHGRGYVLNHYATGRAYFEWGTSTQYGQTSNALEITDEFDYFTLDMDFTKLKPNTTYHWRIRFVTPTGTVIKGADQTFKTKAGS